MVARDTTAGVTCGRVCSRLIVVGGAASGPAFDPGDVRWGRRPGARPPLRVWPLVAVAAGLAVSLVVAVLAVPAPGPLDDPHPGNQRTGLLFQGPRLPSERAGVRFGDCPVVLLFLREPAGSRQLRAWAAAVPACVDVAVVVQGPRAVEDPDRPALVVTDADQVLARAVALPAPRNGGPGIGYAVVDSDRVLRYSTLDPQWTDHGGEMATIVAAVP